MRDVPHEIQKDHLARLESEQLLKQKQQLEAEDRIAIRRSEERRKRLEARARYLAKKNDCYITRSRRSFSVDNAGGFMIVDCYTNGCLAGERFDLSAQDVIDWFTNL